MSRITLRNGTDTVELSHIGPGAEIVESVAGEQTIRFTVLPEDAGSVSFSTRVEFEGQYYTPKRIAWRGNALGVFAEVEAEHAAYALSDLTVETISLTGTNAAVLSRILSGTGLTAGSCVSGSLSAGTMENVTRREALITAAALMGGELSFSGTTVSVTAHRGNAERVNLMDAADVLSVEKVFEAGADPVYRVALGRRGTLGVGDEIRLVYAPLGLDVNTRIISMRRNPYNDREVSVEIGRHVPEITDKFVKQEKAVRQAQAKADEAKTAADEAKSTAEATQTALGSYVKTSEVSAKVDQYVNSSEGKASITASLSGIYQTVDGMSGYEQKTELSADIGAYIDTQAGTARLTAALSGTFAEKRAFEGYVKKTELSADIGEYIDTQAGTARLKAALSGTFVEGSELDMYEKISDLSADIGAYIDTQAGTAKVVSACSGHYVDFDFIEDYEKITDLAADIGQYIDSQAGTAKITEAVSGTYAEKTALGDYEKKTDLSADIGAYIDTQAGTAKVVSACSGTYQTRSGMSDYVTVTGLNTSIGQYLDTATGKAKIESAVSGTYQKKSDMGDYVETSELNTKIGQYIDGSAGTAKIVSACSGTYQTQAGMSSYYTKTQVDAEISQSVSPIESAISLTASFGSGSIGSNVRALLQLVANADSSSINIKADKIDFAGFTTFLRASDLGSNGSTTIDGGRITTGEISADRIKVQKLYAAYSSSVYPIAYANSNGLYIGLYDTTSTCIANTRIYGSSVHIGGNSGVDVLFDTALHVFRPQSSSSNFTIGTSSYQFKALYAKEIYLNGTAISAGGGGIEATDVKKIYCESSTSNYIGLSSAKDFVASGTGFSLGSTSYPFDEFFCGSASYYLKHTSAGIIPNTTSTSASYFQLGSSSYPFNDLYVKNLHVSGSFDMSGSTVKMGGTSSYYIEANTSRELKPSSSSATYPAYLGTSSIYWHYAYIGSNTAIIGSSGTSTGSKLGFFGTTAVVRQTLSLTSNNMSYTSVTSANYLYALNNLIGILKKHGLITT